METITIFIGVGCFFLLGCAGKLLLAAADLMRAKARTMLSEYGLDDF